jgi:hypothetical protein
MKPFDLELAKKGHLIITRNGSPARIIALDINHKDYPLAVALKSDKNENEYIHGYTIEGKFYRNHLINHSVSCEYDLFMKE